MVKGTLNNDGLVHQFPFAPNVAIFENPCSQLIESWALQTVLGFVIEVQDVCLLRLQEWFTFSSDVPPSWIDGGLSLWELGSGWWRIWVCLMLMFSPGPVYIRWKALGICWMRFSQKAAMLLLSAYRNSGNLRIRCLCFAAFGRAPARLKSSSSIRYEISMPSGWLTRLSF